MRENLELNARAKCPANRNGGIKMRMKWNNVMKSLLKTAVYVMDQTSDKVDRVSERASEFADDARTTFFLKKITLCATFYCLRPELESESVQQCCSLQAAARILRNSIGEKVQDISDKVKSRDVKPELRSNRDRVGEVLANRTSQAARRSTR